MHVRKYAKKKQWFTLTTLTAKFRIIDRKIIDLIHFTLNNNRQMKLLRTKKKLLIYRFSFTNRTTQFELHWVWISVLPIVHHLSCSDFGVLNFYSCVIFSRASSVLWTKRAAQSSGWKKSHTYATTTIQLSWDSSVCSC